MFVLGPSESQVRVSVIIVLYNSAEPARACLESIRKHCRESMEILVVDNASPQGGLNRLAVEFPQVRFLANRENIGFAGAVNQAAALASGRFLFLLNPDCELMDDAPAVLARWLEERDRAGAAGPRLLFSDGGLQTSTYRFPTLFQSAGNLFMLKRLVPLALVRRLAPAWLAGRFGQLNHHREADRVDYCTGAALMIKRRVFEQVGGLDERFFLYYEEKDFCLRVKQAGFEVWFVPRAKVMHAVGASSDTARELATLARYQSMLAYFDKHQPGKLAVLKLLLKMGAVYRHALCGLAGRAEEAGVWRKVYGLAGD